MKMTGFLLTSAVILVVGLACGFNEYVQSENVIENIDEYRTGCEIDADSLMAGFKQYDANKYHIDFGFGTPEPTPTPSPVTDTEVSTKVLLERIWENGCQTGRRDVVGSEQATLMILQDQLNVLEKKIEALE